jgi:uncharacterized membrane protein YeaQ/YmgE (transglycosylase-associated protein family)
MVSSWLWLTVALMKNVAAVPRVQPLLWCRSMIGLSRTVSHRRSSPVPATLAGENIMTIETFLLWIAIGLIAGWLASAVVGGGFGIVGDIVIGIVGAFVGGLIFRRLDIHTPFRGLASTIFVAFVGAVVLLLILRLLRWGSTRRS